MELDRRDRLRGALGCHRERDERVHVGVLAVLNEPPAALTLDTYGHVIEELADGERVSAEDAIRLARAESVPVSYLRADAA